MQTIFAEPLLSAARASSWFVTSLDSELTPAEIFPVLCCYFTRLGTTHFVSTQSNQAPLPTTGPGETWYSKVERQPSPQIISSFKIQIHCSIAPTRPREPPLPFTSTRPRMLCQFCPITSSIDVHKTLLNPEAHPRQLFVCVFFSHKRYTLQT